MIIKRQYLDYEKSNGFIMTKVLNPSYANDTIPFDVFEAVHNPGESGALFIPTRVMVTRNQGQKGSCENPGYPCDSDEDCDTGDDMSTGKCSNSMCVRRGWCPSETVRTPGTEVYKIDASSYDLWFQGRVLYHKFRADVGNTEDPSPIFYPNENANTYPMHDILRMAEVGVDDIWKDGAIILVSALFDCDLSKDSCETTIESVAVHTATGFNFKHANYYEEGGERKRDSYWFYGIRLIIFSTGLGFPPSSQLDVELAPWWAARGGRASLFRSFPSGRSSSSCAGCCRPERRRGARLPNLRRTHASSLLRRLLAQFNRSCAAGARRRPRSRAGNARLFPFRFSSSVVA